jgi:predicted AlkP superfamily phosphohydrolase/phosphomutase
MVVLKLVDNLQHKTWKYIDPRWAPRYPRRAQMVDECFAELDRVFGQLVDYAEQHDAAVFVMSDHGHGALEGQAQPNYLLRKWDYLTLKPGPNRAATRGRRILRRLSGGKRGKFAGGTFSIEHDLAVDFSRTQACVMHAGMSGFLYLNLAGRQESGIVRPDEYESIRDVLQRRFREVTTQSPEGNTIHVFKDVHKPEDLYGCSRNGRPWLPDLLLVPHDGLAVVRKIRSGGPVRWLPRSRIEGTHRANGIFAARGAGIARGRQVDADIIDATPTLLAMLGLRIPDDMEGQVIEPLFDPPLKVGRESAPEVHAAGANEIYSEEEMQKITERLIDLGYLQ